MLEKDSSESAAQSTDPGGAAATAKLALDAALLSDVIRHLCDR